MLLFVLQVLKVKHPRKLRTNPKMSHIDNSSKSTSDSDTSSNSSSDSDISSNSSSDSDLNELNEVATQICTKWSPAKLMTDFQGNYNLLTKISIDILNVIFGRMQQKDQRSIYLTNEAFKTLLREWSDWSKWIPTDNCGLHKKFKMNTGVLHYLLTGIEAIQSDQRKLTQINCEIYENTDYESLEHLLDYGMFSYHIHRKLNFIVKQFFVLTGEDAKYICTKSTQRPDKSIINIFDKIIGITNNTNKQLKACWKYRFFGSTFPSKEKVALFLQYDAICNGDIWDMDKIYYPLLSKHRKIIFENDNYNDKISSKGKNFVLNWQNAQTLKESFDPLIQGLLKAKTDYFENKKKKEQEYEKRKQQAIKETNRRRATKKRDTQIITTLEGEEDYEIDDIDKQQQQIDTELTEQYQRNHNIRNFAFNVRVSKQSENDANKFYCSTIFLELFQQTETQW